MKLTHMMDPSTLGHVREAKIHYRALNGQELLCGLGRIFREIDGEQFQVWQETKRPVNCSSCTKRIESLVRFQVNGLNATQLEEILAHIESFKHDDGLTVHADMIEQANGRHPRKGVNS